MFSSGQKAVFLCPCNGDDPGSDGNNCECGASKRDRLQDGRTNRFASTEDGEASSKDVTELSRVEWVRAEEQYGLVRPSPGETVIVVH